MTRKEAKRRAKLYSALAEGKKIQFNQENGEWADLTMELIEVLSENAFRYRIKPEPKYRPFNSQEECWNEMLKHQPFGWVIENASNNYKNIAIVFEHTVSFCDITDFQIDFNLNLMLKDFNSMFKDFKFIDGTPFGIKEE